jgi:hypothetical protein
MPEYGVVSTGINIKRLADIKLEIENAIKADFGDSINLDPASLLGQQVGIFSKAVSDAWELLGDIYDSQYPASSSGVSLENVAALVGIVKQTATKSTVVVQKLFGTVSTVVPSGTVFSVSGNSAARFVTDADVTLIAGTDEVQTISFSATPTSGSFKLVLDDETTAAISYTADAAAVQAALRALNALSAVTVSGTFATNFVVTFTGADGLQAQSLMTVDSNTLDAGGAVTVTIAETTPGVNQGAASMTAETAGAIVVPARSLTVIETPVSGLTSTKNTFAGVTGQDLETDAELRIRRALSTQISGNATVEAIRSELLDIANVLSVSIFENATNTTDGDGRPAKSYECVVQDGDEDTIAAKMWETKPAGIETTSTATGGDKITKVVTDSQGISHTIYFSRPTPIIIYLDLTLTVTSDYPADGDTQVENAVIAYGDSLGVGDDVIVFPKLIASMNNIAGITDIVVVIAAISKASGTNTSVSANKLVDSGATFVTNGVAINDIVVNDTDNTRTTVSNVDSETQLSLNADIFTATGKSYRVLTTGDANIPIGVTEIASFLAANISVTS